MSDRVRCDLLESIVDDIRPLAHQTGRIMAGLVVDILGQASSACTPPGAEDKSKKLGRHSGGAVCSVHEVL